MFIIEDLLKELINISSIVEVGKDEDFDFTRDSEAFVIESGNILSFADKKSVVGVRATQTFGPFDPVGFAEVIGAKEKTTSFKPLTDLRLHKFSASVIKAKIGVSNILAESIIKYSIGRIFSHRKTGGNILLEDKFIYSNYKSLGQFNVPEGEFIFKVGEQAEVMYFIEKGGVEIGTGNGKPIARLIAGDCFGEAALIKERARNFSARAVRPTRLVLIEREVVKKELEREHAMVRLVVILLLKRLDLMNKLNLIQTES